MSDNTAGQPEPDDTAAFTALMDQNLALVSDAARGLIDTAEGEPVIDVWMYALGCELIRDSTHDDEELIQLLAAALMQLAQHMADAGGAR